MKRCVLAVVFVLTLVTLTMAECPPQPRLVSVTGEAEVKVVPDEIIFTIGAETWDKDLNIAKNNNDTIVKKALALTKDYKIDPKDVQTDYLNIQPRYEFQFEKRSFIGYFVTKNMVITLRDISKFEDFLTAILQTGINNVYGIDFRTTELRKYRGQARDNAIKAAQEKAEALAKDLGQKLGRPYNIAEHLIWENWGFSRGMQMQMQYAVTEDRSGSVSESTIALGQLKVKARVNVSFELE